MFYCILIVLFALALNGCREKSISTSTGLSSEGQIKIVDSLGRQIILKKPVQRAVVANAYNAELINAIGAIDKVVGVDYYIYQDQEGFKNRFTKDMLIGQNRGEINYEKVIALKPDAFIMTSNGAWQEAEAKLKLFGIEIILVDSYYASRFKENVKLLGCIFGRGKEAQAFSDYFMSKIEYIGQKLKGVPKKTVYFEYRSKGRTTVAGDYFSDMVDLAHADNIFRNAKSTTVDVEAVVKSNPQYIVKVSEENVDSSYIPPTLADMDRIKKEIISRPSWEYMDAVKNDNILLLSHYVHGGASKLVGTMYIAKFLYPEQLKELNPEEIFKDWVTKYQGLDYRSGHTYPAFNL